jgi:hypothetical protein
MTTYACEIENQMRLFFDSLSEKDRRRYAAVEAAKLDYGGIEYISRVLDCDSNTIRHGMEDVQQLPDDEAAGRTRKKGRSKES